MDLIDNGLLRLVSYDLDQNALRPPAIEFAVEYGLPRSEVESTFGDGNDNFAAHYLSFVMGVPVIFTRAIVFVAADWFMWGKFFEPAFVVIVQSTLIVVYEDACCYVHGIYEAQSFADATLCNRFLHLRRYVNKVHSCRDIKGKIFRVTLHGISHCLLNSVKTLSPLRHLNYSDASYQEIQTENDAICFPATAIFKAE